MPFAGFRAAEVDEHAGPAALMEMPQVAASPFLPNPLLIPVPPFVAMRMRAQPCICSGAFKSLHSADDASAASHRASALPGSAISSTEPYHQASQPASGRPVNTIRFSG